MVRERSMRAQLEAQARQQSTPRGDERRSPEGGAGTECKVCMAGPVEVALQPCKHAVMCYTCSMTVTSCPICRAPISDRMQIFM